MKRQGLTLIATMVVSSLLVGAACGDDTGDGAPSEKPLQVKDVDGVIQFEELLSDGRRVTCIKVWEYVYGGKSVAVSCDWAGAR